MKLLHVLILQVAASTAVANGEPCAEAGNADAAVADFEVTVVGEDPINASAHFLQACHNFQQIWGVETMSGKRVVAVVMKLDRTESSRVEGVCGDQAIERNALQRAEGSGRMTPTSFYWR